MFSRKIACCVHTAVMLVRLLLHAFAGYCVLRSCGMSVPITSWIGIMTATSLAGLLPVSVGGIGISEGVLAFSLQRFEYGPEEAVFIGLVCRMLYALSLLAWAGMYGVMQMRREKV